MARPRMKIATDIVTETLRPTSFFPKYVRGTHVRAVHPVEVPSAAGQVALRTAVAVADALDLPPVITVCFFAACEAGHPDEIGNAPGLTTPFGLCETRSADRIHIRVGLTLAQTQRTTAHEMRHLWQNQQGWGSGGSAEKARREGDARRFENEWIERNPWR